MYTFHGGGVQTAIKAGKRIRVMTTFSDGVELVKTTEILTSTSRAFRPECMLTDGCILPRAGMYAIRLLSYHAECLVQAIPVTSSTRQTTQKVHILALRLSLAGRGIR